MTPTVNAQPRALDILLTRANDFSVPIQFLDVDGNAITTWAAYSFYATLRPYADADDKIDFDIDDTNAATGLWVVSLDHDVAEKLARTSQDPQYTWDLLRVNDAGRMRTLLAGTCHIRPNVTDTP